MVVLATLNDFSDALEHLAGFVFVLFVLCLLWMLLEAVGALFRRRDRRVAAAALASVVTSPSVTPVPNEQELGEDELIVIAATVAMLLGRRTHRIVSIRSSGLDWSREGRRQHLHSHKVQK